MAAESDLVCGRSQFLWLGPWWQGWWRLGGGVGHEYCFSFLLFPFFINLETF